MSSLRKETAKGMQLFLLVLVIFKVVFTLLTELTTFKLEHFQIKVKKTSF